MPEDELCHRLLSEQNECTLAWVTKANTSAATVVSFIYREGRIWMTAQAGSGRVKAIQRNPSVSVVVSGLGTELGHSRCVSVQGTCEIVADPAVRAWFFPAFSSAVLPDSAQGAAMMAAAMDSDDNVVLVVTPRRLIPYDAHDMLEAANGLGVDA